MKLFEPKIFSAFKGYKAKDYISDIVAGIIVAIIALPLSIALAIASGATPERGLFTAIIAGFITSLLGGSRVNITGPTAAFATIVAGIILTQGVDGLFLATIMAGIILVIMGLCRVGSLIKYIPHTITVGFTGGIAVTLVIGQLKDFLGLTYPSGTVAIESMEKLALVFEHISTFNPWALVVGLLGLAILIFWPKLSKKIPGSLIAVIVGALVCLIPVVSVNTIGSLYTISSALPTFSFPEITWERILALLPSAFTIALLAGIESLLSCVVSDKMVNDKHNSNTELMALGASNIMVGMFGGIPATGAIARTAANVKNGGKSPLSGMVHALVLLLVLVVLMPLASFIPMSIIAAILFIVAYNMSEWREFVAIIKTKKWNDILVLVVTFALTVIFDLVKAIAVGLVIHYVIVLIFYIVKKRKEKKGQSVTEEVVSSEEMVEPNEEVAEQPSEE
ncbi:MAG: sodium-independent anion transporter [Clostridia bacterium]|nr:sodium-independent anion transporter [Clostridia bacterium]